MTSPRLLSTDDITALLPLWTRAQAFTSTRTGWVRDVVGRVWQGAPHLPYFFVADFALALTQSPPSRRRPQDDEPAAERRQRRRYEDHIFNAMLTTAEWADASHPCQHLVGEAQLQRVVDTILAICAPLPPDPAGVLGSRHALQRAAPLPASAPTLSDDDDDWAMVRESRNRLTESVSSPLLTSHVLYELRHLQALPRASQRLALRQIRHQQDTLPSPSPALQQQMRLVSALAPEARVDDGGFPAGGFSSIRTGGPLENIVRSELLYRDLRVGDVDAFTHRVLDQQHLTYTREEAMTPSPVRQWRICIHAPHLLRQQMPPFSAQLQVLLFASIAEWVSVWQHLLGRSAVWADVVLLDRDDDDERCAEDISVLQSLFLDDLPYGRVRIGTDLPRADDVHVVSVGHQLPPSLHTSDTCTAVGLTHDGWNVDGQTFTPDVEGAADAHRAILLKTMRSAR